MADEPTNYGHFPTLLGHFEQGRLADDLRKAVTEVVAALHADNAGQAPKGSITMTIALKLDDGLIEARADIKTKLPPVKRGRTMFWATPENNLSPVNPRQHALALEQTEEVDRRPTLVRS